jgi:hypothetical protein
LVARKGDHADSQYAGNGESDEFVHLWVSNLKKCFRQFAALQARRPDRDWFAVPWESAPVAFGFDDCRECAAHEI